ncbi:hypothetical protein T492DRAFT_512111 [Pavlovales sp. CCMP2436]|nr:hypothetical protein T492DRAFT_512111 [Pavlovales sp. CCMP2436]
MLLLFLLVIITVVVFIIIYHHHSYTRSHSHSRYSSARNFNWSARCDGATRYKRAAAFKRAAAYEPAGIANPPRVRAHFFCFFLKIIYSSTSFLPYLFLYFLAYSGESGRLACSRMRAGLSRAQRMLRCLQCTNLYASKVNTHVHARTHTHHHYPLPPPPPLSLTHTHATHETCGLTSPVEGNGACSARIFKHRRHTHTHTHHTVELKHL